MHSPVCVTFFFFNDTATTEIYTLSLHDALPICSAFGIENVEFSQTFLLQNVPERSREDAKSVTNAALERDAGSIFRIPRWTGNFADGKAPKNGLRQHLIVENEII